MRGILVRTSLTASYHYEPSIKSFKNSIFCRIKQQNYFLKSYYFRSTTVALITLLRTGICIDLTVNRNDTALYGIGQQLAEEGCDRSIG